MNTFIDIVKDKSNDELLKMVYEFDQWSPEMLEAVEQELAKRNILPTDIRIQKHKLIENEKSELSQGKEASLLVLIIGWIMVFGFGGILIGYNYAFSKVNSKYSSQRYFKYDDTSRKNGTFLFYSSLILTTVLILGKFLKMTGTTF